MSRYELYCENVKINESENPQKIVEVANGITLSRPISLYEKLNEFQGQLGYETGICIEETTILKNCATK